MVYIVLVLVAVTILYVWDWNCRKPYAKCSKIIPGLNSLPIFGDCLALSLLDTEAFFQKIIEFSKKYGRFFRLWGAQTFYVFLNDPKDIEVLLIDNVNLKKSDAYQFLLPWIGDGLLTTKGTKWRRNRKVITPAFHFASLNAFFPVFNKNARILIKCLEAEVGKGPFNIFHYINRAALDNICETAMGAQYNVQLTLNSKYLQSVKTICRAAWQRIYNALLWQDFIFNRTELGKNQREAIEFINASTMELIKKRRNALTNSQTTLSDAPKSSFLDILLESTSCMMSNAELQDEINTFMFEGHDTVSTSTSFALYELSRNPDIQEKVYQELVTVLGDNDNPVTMAKVNELPYLQKVVKETLRVYPPSPAYGRQLESDLTLSDGVVIPKGTNVMVNVYGAHHNPKFWPNPDVFDPENFEKDVQPFTFVPFSAGARNCIGQKFAQLEMKAVISWTLRKYRLLPDPNHKLLLTNEFVLISKSGMNISIEKRKP